MNSRPSISTKPFGKPGATKLTLRPEELRPDNEIDPGKATELLTDSTGLTTANPAVP